jgi:hypothetical protein
MRLFGVAYVVTAALAVYRMAKDMRTYYTARRAHATTRKKAIYAFDIFIGYTVSCGPTSMTGVSQLGRYRPEIYITDWTMPHDIVNKVNALIAERLSSVKMTISNTKADFFCHIFARCSTKTGGSIFGKSDDRYIRFNYETYLPADLMPCGRSAKKALAGLPKRIYM